VVRCRLTRAWRDYYLHEAEVARRLDGFSDPHVFEALAAEIDQRIRNGTAKAICRSMKEFPDGHPPDQRVVPWIESGAKDEERKYHSSV
jgi:hypothetical protein